MAEKRKVYVIEYSVTRVFKYEAYPSEFSGSALNQLVAQSGLFQSSDVIPESIKFYTEEG